MPEFNLSVVFSSLPEVRLRPCSVISKPNWIEGD
jgi:hypothetical protein